MKKPALLGRSEGGALALVAFVLVATACGCGQARSTRLTLGDTLDVTLRSYDGDDGRTLYAITARAPRRENAHDPPPPIDGDSAHARECRAAETQLALAFRGHRPTGIRLHGTRASCDA